MIYRSADGINKLHNLKLRVNGQTPPYSLVWEDIKLLRIYRQIPGKDVEFTIGEYNKSNLLKFYSEDSHDTQKG